MCTSHLLKHLQAFGRFTFPLSHSLPRGIDVTAKPLSKCVPLCRPTWVHSVIPRKGVVVMVVMVVMMMLMVVVVIGGDGDGW